MIEQIFKEFGLTDKEVKVYLSLLEYGARTAGNLARDIDIARATLYGHLDKLQAIGFVTAIAQDNVKMFSPEHPEKLNLLYKQKLDRMQVMQKQFESNIPELMAQADSKNLRPRLQYFENQHAMHSMMNDMLLYRDITVYSFWPVQSMIETMGEDYLTHFNVVRVKKNIELKAIWPPAQAVDVRRYPFMGTGDKFLREMRVAPADINARLSYMIYGDKVMVASSRRESYGFILQSQDMADMLIDQFAMIWNISKEIADTGQDGQGFLDLLEQYGDDWAKEY